MNKNLKRIAALLLAIAMVASFAACKNDKNNNDTTAAGDIAINGDAIADDLLPEASSEATSDSTAAETEIVTDKEGHTVIETKAPADNSAKPSNGKPESYAEILAAYRDVLNLAKSSKVGYEKSEWQTLPKDKRNFDGFVINAALPVAELFMTSEKDAKGKKHENNPKGTDMKWFPIYQHPTKGCTLTDVSKIKSAKCEVLSNGNYKITIVLKADIRRALSPRASPERCSAPLQRPISTTPSRTTPESQRSSRMLSIRSSIMTAPQFLLTIPRTTTWLHSTSICMFLSPAPARCSAASLTAVLFSTTSLR